MTSKTINKAPQECILEDTGVLKQFFTLKPTVQLDVVGKSQESNVNVTECEFYDEITGNCYIDELMPHGGREDITCKNINNANCHFKKWQRAEQQLHSQEKTFTVSDIKNIIKNKYDELKKLGENKDISIRTLLDFSASQLISLLQEFEKEVG